MRDYLQYFTDFEIASLIVPRKLFIEAGSRDSRTEGAIEVQKSVEILYNKLNLPLDYVSIGIEKGGHEIFLNGSLKFLNKFLKNN